MNPTAPITTLTDLDPMQRGYVPREEVIKNGQSQATPSAAFLAALGHQSVLEICIFKNKKPSYRGYFNDPKKAADAIRQRDGRSNCFVTLNPCQQALLARGNNRLVEASYDNPIERTKDSEIISDNWFLIDIDPKRPSGISATDEELSKAAEVAKAVYGYLLSIGVPAESFIKGTSGNGYYLLIRLPNCPINEKNTATKQVLVNFLADRFDTDVIEIDRTVFNPARLICVLGTMKVKGDSTEDRPHRRSEVYTIGGAAFDPTKSQRCTPFDLYALAEAIIPKSEPKSAIKPEAKPTASTPNAEAFDIRNFTHLLTGERTTSRGFTEYDCPACGGSKKLWIEDATGKYGCFHIPAGTCSTRAIREALGQPKGFLKPLEWPQTSKENKPQLEQKLLLNIQRMADIEPIQTDWLWFPYIPLGKLTMFEGDPGLGKSWITCAFATAIAAGKGLPGMPETAPRSVLMFFTEDGAADTVRPRLDSMRADVSRIYAVDEPVSLDDPGLLAIEEAIIETKAQLVTIDPLLGFLGSGVDMHRANETRPVMQRLKAMAERHNVAFVLVRHLSKGGTNKAIYRGLGSIDFTAAVRSVLLAGQDPDDPSKRAIIQTKNNLAAFGNSIGYELRPDHPDAPFAWTGISTLTSDRVLNAIAQDEEVALGRREAKEFLSEILLAGEKPVDEVMKLARKAGISERTLKRAKAELGIASRKTGSPSSGKQEWFWSLSDEECQGSAEGCQKEDVGTLRINSEDKSGYISKLGEECQAYRSGTLRAESGTLHPDEEVF